MQSKEMQDEADFPPLYSYFQMKDNIFGLLSHVDIWEFVPLNIEKLISEQTFTELNHQFYQMYTFCCIARDDNQINAGDQSLLKILPKVWQTFQKEKRKSDL